MSISSLILAVTVIAHEPGYFTSLANHLSRWLGSEGIQAPVVTVQDMPRALARERLAFLVGFDAPAPDELATLRAFRARGGKLVVFHSSSPALGALMGVRPLGYATAPKPGAWSLMVFDGRLLAGCPDAILQTSTVLQRAAPAHPDARVLATWHDRNGRSSGEPAWIATPAGWWMTHVLLADGDEHLKAQLVGAFCGSADPASWSFAVHAARERNLTAAWRQQAQAQPARRGEIHAVWDHSGCGTHPGDWPRTMRLLADSGVTDLFTNVAGAGFAHYPSDILPRSKTYAQEGDQLAACLAAARRYGIRVHAWILCFTATRGSPERLEECRRRGWRLKDAKGRLTEYLDPSNRELRAQLMAVLDELQTRYPALSGIHLDFVRWYEGAAKPARADETIGSFVSEARRRVRRPRWLTAAVLGKYPACIASVGQDWSGWLDARLVDYVVPMDYTESPERLAAYLAQHAALKGHAARTIAGLGVTANESRLNAAQVMAQIAQTRRAGLAGNALFDLDTFLEKRILPYLKIGPWRKRNE